jgi:hypothetical protein
MSDWYPEECGKCGRKATPKNGRTFVQDLWANPVIWRCNDLAACRARAERREALLKEHAQ